MNGTFASIASILTLTAMAAAGMEAAAKSEIDWVGGTVFNCGDIGEDEGPVSHRFTMVNSSAEPISIISANGKCRCTTASFDKRALNPGDTAYIDVRFDPVGRLGYFNQRVAVNTTTDNSVYYLFVKGNILTSHERIVRDFPTAIGSGIRMKADTICIDMPKRRKFSASLACINEGEATVEPRIADAPKGIDIDIVPARVPAGQRFSIVLSASRKSLQKLMPRQSFTLQCDSATSKQIEIKISK